MFDSTQNVFLGYPELHNLIVGGILFDMKKAIAIKLNDQYAKLTDGSCPSHHSPNDVIPL